MARGPDKQFDPDWALEQAMLLFWENGYEATGIAELVDATGVARASLYGAFGDKEAMFNAALDNYLEQVVDRASAIVDSGIGGIEAYFERLHVVRDTGVLPARRGCMGRTSRMRSPPPIIRS